MQRHMLRAIVRTLFRIFSHVEVSGLENLPSEGGFLIAINHLSRLDPPLAFAFLERDDVTALAADKYKRIPFFRWIVNLVGGIWINREGADLRALREATNFLKNGGVLGIAPEGTRSTTGALIEAKTGVAYLAEKSRVPIVPAAVSGTEDAVRKLARLKRPHLCLKFGEPFKLPPIGHRPRNEGLVRNTDEIMCRIAVLLPPRYHGAYADHACLERFGVENPSESSEL